MKRCTWFGYHVPTYHEGLSRPWDDWLYYWADVVLTHYYGPNAQDLRELYQ